MARRKELGEGFVKIVKQMAISESQATYALPAKARPFDVRPPQQRPAGKPYVSAWGVFQFNRDAWTCLVPKSERPTRRSFIPDAPVGAGGCKGCRGDREGASCRGTPRPPRKSSVPSINMPINLKTAVEG